MTTPPTPQHARLLGVLGFAALLSPSGKIISGAAAVTLLAGGLVTQLRPPSPPAAQATAPTPVAPTHLTHGASSAPVLTYIEIDGQTLPVVLTEGTTGGNTSDAGGLLSGGGGQMRGPGSPQVSPRHAALDLSGHRASAFERGGSRPSDNPMKSSPPALTGPSPSVLQIAALEAARSRAPTASVAAPAGSSKAAGFGEPGETGAPLQSEPRNEPLKSLPAKLPDPSESTATPASVVAPDKGVPLDSLPAVPPGPDPLAGFSNPASYREPGETGTPLQAEPELPEPLFTSPYGGQSLPLIAAVVPEPSVIGLMLLGLAALGWTGRRRGPPTRRA